MQLLDTQQPAGVDPILEDFKKEQERQRAKPVYRDPDVVAKEIYREQRKLATEIANTYPLDTNTYGKTKLATIEKLQNRRNNLV